MITFHPTSLEEIRGAGDYDSVFKSVCINEEGTDGIPSYLFNASLIKAVDYDGKLLGMVSVEPCEGLGVETHAFILPENRKRSRELLEALRDAFFILTPIKFLRTTVTGDHRRLVRFFSILGCDLIRVEHDAVKKGDKTYDLFVLQLNKEINHG